MKRDILCEKCGKETRQRFASLEPFTGEFVLMRRGMVKCDHIICDFCGKVVHGLAVALSIFTTTRPYFAWEPEYMTGIEDYPPGGANEPYGLTTPEDFAPDRSHPETWRD